MNNMIELTAHAWATLDDAYGKADRIPALLRELDSLPPSDSWRSEPYYSLWSALYHQGSVFSGSCAALPYLMHFITTHAQAPQAFGLLQLVVCIEAARANGNGPRLPFSLSSSYEMAIRRLPETVVKLLPIVSGIGDTRILCAAIAVAAKHTELAMSILDPDYLAPA